VTPGSINVIRPPTSLATTGVPQAEDSNATSPKLSERLGTSTTSDARIHVESSWCDWGATKLTCRSRPPPRPGGGAGRASIDRPVPRAPDNRQHGVASRARSSINVSKSQVDALQGLEATDEEQHRVLTLDARRAGLGVDSPGRRRRVRRRGARRARARIGVIEATNCSARPGNWRAPRRRRRRLAASWKARSSGFTFVEIGLHALKRVEGHDERNAELVLKAVAGQTTEPVVRVDGVGSPVTTKERRDRVGELRDVVGETFAIERGGWPGRDVVDSKTGSTCTVSRSWVLSRRRIDVDVCPSRARALESSRT